MSQLQLAERLDMTAPAISQYETGKRQADMDTVRIIAGVFGVSVDYLLGRTDVRELPTEDSYDLPPDLEMALRGKRWHQLKPETRRIIASVIRQIDAELEAEDEKEKNGKRRNE